MIDFIAGQLGWFFTAVLLALGWRAWLGIGGEVVTGPQCKACGYSREGIPIETPCPECGEEQKYPGSVLHIRKRMTVRSPKRIAIDLLMIIAVIGIAYGTIRLDDWRLNYYQGFAQAIQNGDIAKVQDYLNRYPELALGRFRYVNRSADSSGPLVYAANNSASNRTAMIHLLLKHGADPNVSRGEAFRFAIEADDTVLMDDLLLAGFLINTYADDRQESWITTALLYDRQKTTALELLLDRGADPNRFSDRPPLIQAVGHQNKTRVTQLLLEAGADPNLGDSRGYTPLMYAVSQQCVACVKLLLDAGAKDIANDEGTTAEDLARQFTRRTPEKGQTAETILEILILHRRTTAIKENADETALDPSTTSE